MVQNLLFVLDGQSFALSAASVQRVARIVEITPLPKAPEAVLGVVNIGGKIIPVADLRKRFGLPARELELSDQLIVVRASTRTVAMVADQVTGMVESSQAEIMGAEEILPGLDYIDGVIKMADGITFIYNLDKFFSLEEEETLDNALGQIGKEA